MFFKITLNIGAVVKICKFLPPLSSRVRIHSQEFCGLHHAAWRGQRDRQCVNKAGSMLRGLGGDMLWTKPVLMAV